jgi:hypothetical protein
MSKVPNKMPALYKERIVRVISEHVSGGVLLGERAKR